MLNNKNQILSKINISIMKNKIFRIVMQIKFDKNSSVILVLK